MVLSAGFLAIMRTIRVTGSVLLDVVAAVPSRRPTPDNGPVNAPVLDERIVVAPGPKAQVMRSLSRAIAAPRPASPGDEADEAHRRRMNGAGK